ncbi:MAG: phasin family protein [Candidatus Berkiella sp.]
MTANMFEQWAKMSKSTTEPMLEFGALCTRFWSDLAKQNLQAGSDFVQSQSEQLGYLAQAKSPEEFMTQQTKWANKQAPKAFEYAEQTLATAQEGMKECAKFYQKYASQFNKPDLKTTQK